MNKEFQLSPFLHIINGEEVTKDYSILYNSLSLGSVIVHKNIANFFSSLKNKKIINIDLISKELSILKEKESLISELEKHRIIIPVYKNPYEDYVLASKFLKNVNIGILYLLVTDVCNCKCSYCYVENNIPSEYKYSKMTKEIAESGIEIFSNLINENNIIRPKIIFYGGEPLLNFPVIESTVTQIEEKINSQKLPKLTEKILNTNGTLINNDIAEFLHKNRVVVSLSLDGPEKIHNLTRKYISGKGTFKDVLKGYQILKKHNVEVGISCTVGEHNIDELETILEWIESNFSISSIGFNLLIQSNINDFNKLYQYADKAAEKLIGCFQLCREKGIYEERIMRKVRAFVEGYILYSDCGGCGQQIVIDPEGNIGVCHAFCGTKEFFVSETKDINFHNHQYWKEWRYRSPLVMPQCIDCIALGICGGGCPFSAFKQKGSIWELDEINCILSKKVTEFLLKDLMNKKIKLTGTAMCKSE